MGRCRRGERVGSGATTRPKREKLIEVARRREIDLVLVWRLDRWGRSLVDLVSTLQELNALDVGFVSLCEALDLTTPSGRAFAGMLAVFAEFEQDILRDRVKAGIDQAGKDGKPPGRPKTAGKLVSEMKQLRKDGLSKRAIAKAPRGQPHLRHPVATSQEALAALAGNFDQWRSDPHQSSLFRFHNDLPIATLTIACRPLSSAYT